MGVSPSHGKGGGLLINPFWDLGRYAITKSVTLITKLINEEWLDPSVLGNNDSATIKGPFQTDQQRWYAPCWVMLEDVRPGLTNIVQHLTITCDYWHW
jgi:hypothetical protein